MVAIAARYFILLSGTKMNKPLDKVQISFMKMLLWAWLPGEYFFTPFDVLVRKESQLYKLLVVYIIKYLNQFTMTVLQ